MLFSCSRISLALGSKMSTDGGSEGFRGSIHGLNMYHSVLSPEEILAMSKHCVTVRGLISVHQFGFES